MGGAGQALNNKEKKQLLRRSAPLCQSRHGNARAIEATMERPQL